jgi:hypothetical protein
VTAQTPVYGIKYPVVGEPIRTTRQILQDNAETTEAALIAGGVAAPGAGDVLAVSARVTMLEGITGTEAAIKASAGPHATGRQAWATDTKARGIFDGTRWLFYDTAWQTWTPKLATTNATNYWTQSNGTAIGRFFRKGREVTAEGVLQLGSGSSFGGGLFGTILADFPPGYAPSYWSTPSTTFVPPVGQCQVYGGTFGNGFVAVANMTGAATGRRFAFYTAAQVAATGTGTGWNISASTHGVSFQAVYETAFEA